MGEDQVDGLPPSDAAWQHYADMLGLHDNPYVHKIRAGWKSGFDAGWHERGAQDPVNPLLRESGILVRRSPRAAMEWLADQLLKGAEPEAVALTLWLLAEELDGVSWRDRVTPPPDPV